MKISSSSLKVQAGAVKKDDTRHQNSMQNDGYVKTRKHSSWQSFIFSFRGLKQIIQRERNFRLQLFLMLGSFAAAYFLNCSISEWIAIIICSALVLLAEAANTVFEEMTDWIHSDYHARAGRIKDMAAALPLIAAIFSVLTAAIVFGPKIWALVQSYL